MLLGYQVCKIVMQEDEMSICDVLESVWQTDRRLNQSTINKETYLIGLKTAPFENPLTNKLCQIN